VISSKQDPAEVFLDGVSKGLSPLTLPGVEPGEHTITIKKTGFADYQIIATVNPAQPLKLNIPRLVPLSAPGSADGTPKILFWGAVGLGGLSLLSAGTSGFFFLSANKEQNDGRVDDLDNDGAIDLEELEAEGRKISDKVDIANNIGIISGVLVSTALTSVTVGLILKRKIHKENKQ
jgi:hypothetical protein